MRDTEISETFRRAIIAFEELARVNKTYYKYVAAAIKVAAKDLKKVRL